MSPETTPAIDRVQIFDTTLRDGEQSPGATMNVEEKLVIARQLEQLGVDVIEAGFAASSEGDFEAVRRVAATVTRPIVLSLARTREQDIDARHPGGREGGAPRHPHLHRHLRHPPEAQAHDEPRRRCSTPPCWAVTRGQEAPRLHRVLGRGRVAQRPRLPGAGLRRGDRGRRADDQRARHDRLRAARGVRRALRDADRETRAGRRPRRSGARTATTTSAWPSPTRWPPSQTARARSSARSTASASAPATRRWKRW